MFFQVMVIFQEDIRDDPVIQAQKLYQFLGISEDHRSWFLERKVNESFVIKNTKVDYLLKQLGKLGRSLGAGGFIETIKRNDLVRDIRRQHNQIDLRQIISPISNDTRTSLLEILADDMCVLSEQLKRENLPWPSWRALKNKVTAD